MSNDTFNIQGLSTQQIEASRKKHGTNTLTFKKENGFVDALKSLVKEPMVILLLIASCIYFISGKTGDGIFLASAIVLVAGISLEEKTPLEIQINNFVKKMVISRPHRFFNCLGHQLL
jgi:Ca2+-transporting ATPase